MGDGYCVSSETCAFDVVGAEFLRDVEPGEVIRIDKKGLQSFKYTNNFLMEKSTFPSDRITQNSSPYRNCCHIVSP